MNKYLLLLVLVCVGAGSYIYTEERTIADLRKRLEAHQISAQKLTGDHSRVKAELAELKKSNEVFKDESANLRKQLAEKSGTTGGAVAEGQSGTQKAGGGYMKGLAKMFTDPEMKKSMRVQQMVGIRMMYADLAKELGLSPQDTEQLMEILADRQMDLAAASMAAMEGGGDKDAMASKVSDATKRYEEQLKAVLGDERYKQMQTYEGSMGDRWMMQQWDGQFAATGSPLDTKQKDQLLSIMREERQKSPGANTGFGSGADQAKALEAIRSDEGINKLVASQQDVNKRVLSRARDFLNADQVATLEKVQQQQAEFITMQMKMSREMLGGGGK